MSVSELSSGQLNSKVADIVGWDEGQPPDWCAERGRGLIEKFVSKWDDQPRVKWLRFNSGAWKGLREVVWS